MTKLPARRVISSPSHNFAKKMFCAKKVTKLPDLTVPKYQMILYDVPLYQMTLYDVSMYQMTLYDVPMYQMTLYDVPYLCTK
jgi:hypothetical protein